MRYSLIVNGCQLGHYIAKNGVQVSKDFRAENSIVTMDGTKWATSVPKNKFSVKLQDMPESYYSLVMSQIGRRNTVTVSYTDFEKGVTIENALFYFFNNGYTVDHSVGDITYLNEINFEFEEK